MLKVSTKGSVNKIILLAFMLLAPILSFAQGNVPAPCATSGKLCNPINQDTLTGFLKTLITGILRIGIPLVALAVIYCGFLFVKARGKPEELTKAKDALLYTMIGAAILLGSWA